MFPTNFTEDNPTILRLKEIARTSPISFKLSATLLHGRRPVGTCVPNVHGTSCRGKLCASIHAELNALKQYYGRRMRWSRRYGWYILQEKAKVAKGEKAEFASY